MMMIHHTVAFVDVHLQREGEELEGLFLLVALLATREQRLHVHEHFE